MLRQNCSGVATLSTVDKQRYIPTHSLHNTAYIPHFTSPLLTSPQLTSTQLTSPHLTSVVDPAYFRFIKTGQLWARARNCLVLMSLKYAWIRHCLTPHSSHPHSLHPHSLHPHTSHTCKHDTFPSPCPWKVYHLTPLYQTG